MLVVIILNISYFHQLGAKVFANFSCTAENMIETVIVLDNKIRQKPSFIFWGIVTFKKSKNQLGKSPSIE